MVLQDGAAAAEGKVGVHERFGVVRRTWRWVCTALATAWVIPPSRVSMMMMRSVSPSFECGG